MKRAELMLIVFTTVVAGIAAALFAPWDGVSEILTLRLMYLAFFLGGGFGTLYVLRGTQYDALREVFDENNVAAAIVIAAIFLSIATVIGR